MLCAGSKWRLPVIVLCVLILLSLFSLDTVLHSPVARADAPVTISAIQGTFYPNPNNSGPFDPSVLSTPVFSQSFPVLNFDPPSDAQVNCSNTTGVDENTRPFTDVIPNPDGTCSLLVAQDSNDASTQAGLGNLEMFQATFTANLTLATGGDVTFDFFSDDAFILAIGPELSNPSAQPTYVSGSLTNPPASGYITGFPVVGSYNVITPPTQNTVTVHFPISGTFPIEVDYTECCGGQETLLLGTTFGNPIPPPPGRISNLTLTVTPSTPLYHVEVDVQLQPTNIACPAALTLALGPISSTINDVCNGTQTAPAVVPFVLPVFNPADSSQDLSPASSVTASATLVDQTGQDQHSVTVTTPPAPIWVGVGDSFSSGFHQLKSLPGCLNDPLNCLAIPNDPTFSWVPQAVTQVNNQLQVPAAWQMQADLLAQSGKTTAQMVADQVPSMESDLTNHAGSWNVVSIDGGANDINFGGQLLKFYAGTFFQTPWNVKDPTKCVDTNVLFKTLAQLAPTISQNLNLMVAEAHLFDPNARIVDMEYPYVMNTNNICSKDHSVLKGGTFQWVKGAQSVVDSLDTLHQDIMGNQIIHLDLRAAFGTTPLSELQQIICFGYPHPNATGQGKIASLAATDIINFMP